MLDAGIQAQRAKPWGMNNCFVIIRGMALPFPRRASAQVLCLILVAAILRILLTAQRDVHGVEAYLWLWAQRPALGYFDHPGMQAWIAMPSVALLGATPLGVRAFFILTASLA